MPSAVVPARPPGLVGVRPGDKPAKLANGSIEVLDKLGFAHVTARIPFRALPHETASECHMTLAKLTQGVSFRGADRLDLALHHCCHLVDCTSKAGGRAFDWRAHQ